MSMVKCPECGREISEHAENCPNCGCPKEKFQKQDSVEEVLKKIQEENENPQTQNEKQKEPLGSKGWFCALMVILFFPVGLYFMWKYKHLNTPLRTIITVVFVVAFLGYVATENEGRDNKDKKTVVVESESPKKTNSEKEQNVTVSKDESKEEKTPEPQKEETLEPVIYVQDNEINQVYTSPKDYKGKHIKIGGQIFGNIEQKDGMAYFQMFHDPENSEGNTAVQASLDSVSFKSGDYIIVDGIITGSQSGMNAFGGMVTMLCIDAETIEISDYINVIAPTLKEIPLNLSVDQYGYVVTIEKIEFAEKETRVYVKVNNNGSSKFNFYAFNMKLIQNGKQYELQYNYNADYQEIQSEILQGVESSGIILFPPVDQNSNLQIFCEGHSDNWDEDIQTYQYDVYVN